MKAICIGCDASIDQVAAYAIMHQRDFEEIGRAPTVLGKDDFHAAAMCLECFHLPEHRKRVVKAHFSMPDSLQLMLGNAGSTEIGR